MTPYITESEVEDIALGYFASLGYEFTHEPETSRECVYTELKWSNKIFLALNGQTLGDSISLSGAIQGSFGGVE